MPDQEFEMLVDRHYGALYRFALSLTRHETDARDLTQQTFLVWARKGHQLRDRSKARTWLFTTLHRAFIESRRRAERFAESELDEGSWEVPFLDPEQARQVDAQALLEALEGVDPVFRGAVTLFYLEELSYLEIAEVLNVPLGTVKSRIARGVSQLQALVADGTTRKPIRTP
ncbi:MAG TPA: RNA polymerase subunit sigma-24 [Verrucomicrobiales bacterium]|nr:RNA polymerase subunit sigma-24 [Verrucomicrobiales bacterium]